MRAGKWWAATAAGLLLALLPAGVAAPRAGDRPVLSPIHAEFVDGEKATHYTATLTPAVNPVYVFSFTPPPDDTRCANARQVGNELVYKHAESDGCTHLTPEHNATIGLVVTDAGWVCQATITGTSTHDGPVPADCVSQTAPPPAPPPTPTVTIPKVTKPPPKLTPCRCAKLTAEIVPSSIGFYGVFVPGRMRLEFDVVVTLRCTAGKVGCKAKLVLAPPEPVAKLKSRFLPRDGVIECAGPCGQDVKKTETFNLYAGPELDHRHRPGKTIEIKVTRFCQGRQLVAPERFKLVFDKRGFVDKQKSQLVAKV